MTHPSFLDRQRDAAVEQAKARADLRHRLTSLVLGANAPAREHLGDIVTLADDDHIVQVVNALGERATLWTTVRQGVCDSVYYRTPDAAMLHLLARRTSPRDHTREAGDAAFYAARVLGTTLD